MTNTKEINNYVGKSNVSGKQTVRTAAKDEPGHRGSNPGTERKTISFLLRGLVRKRRHRGNGAHPVRNGCGKRRRKLRGGTPESRGNVYRIGERKFQRRQ